MKGGDKMIKMLCPDCDCELLWTDETQSTGNCAKCKKQFTTRTEITNYRIYKVTLLEKSSKKVAKKKAIKKNKK